MTKNGIYFGNLNSFTLTGQKGVINPLTHVKFCMLFCRLPIFFKINFFKISFRNIIRVSNRLDPDQTRHFVGLYLGPKCLQRLSADDTSW